MNITNSISYRMNGMFIELENDCSKLDFNSDIKIKKILNNGFRFFQYQEPDYAGTIANKLKIFHAQLIYKVESIEPTKKELLLCIIKIIETGIDDFQRIVGVIKKEHERKRAREESCEKEPDCKRQKIFHPQDAEMQAAIDQGNADLEFAKRLMESDECDINHLNQQFNTDLVLARELFKQEQEDADMEYAMQLDRAQTQELAQQTLTSVGASSLAKGEDLETSLNTPKSMTKNTYNFGF